MRTIILAIFLSLSFTSLLDSQLKPRNPIMVINCEEEDSVLKRKLIQVRENGDCPDGYLEINNLCYFIIDCNNNTKFPGWTSLVIFSDDKSDPICILVPDCSGDEENGDEENGDEEAFWNLDTYTCDCILVEDGGGDSKINENSNFPDACTAADIDECGNCKFFDLEEILEEAYEDGLEVIGRIAVGNCAGGGGLNVDCIFVQYNIGDVSYCFVPETQVSGPNQVINFKFTIPDDAENLKIIGCREQGQPQAQAVKLCILSPGPNDDDASNPCGCPDVLVDIYPTSMGEGGEVEKDSDGGCIEVVETPCYAGNFATLFPSLNCQGLSPDELVLYRILIIGEGETIGQALTIEELLNCDLAGGQDFVLELLGAGFGDGDEVGWIFKNVADLNLGELNLGFNLPPPGTPVILVEFFRNPFEESVIILSNRDEGKQNTIIIPACQQVIPTMSTWGFIVLGLGFLIFGSLMFRHRLSAKLI